MASSKASLLLRFREPDAADDFANDFGNDLAQLQVSQWSPKTASQGSSLSGSSQGGNSRHSDSSGSRLGRFLGHGELKTKGTGLLKDEQRSPFLKNLPSVEVSPFERTSPSKGMALIPETPNSESAFFGAKLPQTPLEDVQEPFQKHGRKTSVKLSLTPAQRVGKTPGLRTSNALDNFKFYEKVGRGAHADVYRGRNLRTNQIVAIKQIPLEKDHDLRALMGEIDLLKILKHENIVKYHGFVKTLNSLNVFLEYCAGGSLRQLYKRLGHGFLEPQLVLYVKPILHGLGYLHEQGVVHRDVKAANVLLTESGEVKLADFGVATKVATLHNTVVGTPNWMAPETVLGGEGICTASDVWSLGATIIELFTTNPPYHELNPMATLHAIGTDDHPPLPSGLTPLAKDFLLECFQKQPTLRVSSKNLLRHRWMCDTDLVSGTKWDLGSRLSNEVSKREDLEASTPSKASAIVTSPLKERYTRNELLSKFKEGDDEVDFLKSSTNGSLSLKLHAKDDEDNEKDPSEESDPFLELLVDNFDTNELEVQSKMELLCLKLISRVDNCHFGHEETTKSLLKITGRMLQLVKKYNILHETLIRNHGILTLLELLENAPEMHDLSRLWYHVLATLNYTFENNLAQLENFALLGGIPMMTQFSKLSYGLQPRLQVVRFIKIIRKSDRALTMFVSSGGLRILSRFLEEDFDQAPDFPLVSIHCIHEILSKGITRFKSDMCRILSKYGVVFWFVVLLNRLTKYTKLPENLVPEEYVDLTIDKILDVLKYFGQAEPRVRINIVSTDLVKLLIKVYPSLNLQRQMVILKFFRSISCISELLRLLHSADILEFFVSILHEHPAYSAHYKEVLNIVCPSIYNCCYLNHNKELELVKLGAIPIFKELSKINLPFRQFVLPILCEFVYCENYVRQMLIRFNIVNVYLNLLLDPYWHSNAMDSILHWSSQELNFKWLDEPHARECLLSGFMLAQVSNLEAALNNYLQLVSSSNQVLLLMTRDSIVSQILTKLTVYNRNPVVKLSLLRILHHIVLNSTKHGGLTTTESIKPTLATVTAKESSVLIGELVAKIMALLEQPVLQSVGSCEPRQPLNVEKS